MKILILPLVLVATLFPCNEARPQIEDFNSTGSTHNEKTIPIMEETPKESKTRMDNYLDPEAIAKMKTLCPKFTNSTDFEIVLHRYFEPRGTCFRYGLKGPCREGMKLFIKEYGSIYGQCDCRSDVRMWVYQEKTDACYKIFSQGGCSEGNYLDVTQQGLPICTPNPCASNGTDFYKLRGLCTRIGKPNKELCEGNEVVDFIPNRRTPECVLLQQVVTPVGVVPCKPGSLLAINGKCHVAEWDFGKED